MMRFSLVCALMTMATVVVGCQKSQDPPRQAQRAIAGLMPDGEPGADFDYVADQKQVKLLPARQVSYEPLDVFRKANAAAEADREASRPNEESAALASPEPSSEPVRPEEEAASAQSEGDDVEADEPDEQAAETENEGPDDQADEADTDESEEQADEEVADEQSEQDGDEPAEAASKAGEDDE